MWGRISKLLVLRNLIGFIWVSVKDCGQIKMGRSRGLEVGW